LLRFVPNDATLDIFDVSCDLVTARFELKDGLASDLDGFVFDLDIPANRGANCGQLLQLAFRVRLATIATL
jgi:hypothetical protein